jgi:hypothetical protein
VTAPTYGRVITVDMFVGCDDLVTHLCSRSMCHITFDDPPVAALSAMAPFAALRRRVNLLELFTK